jgi:hypothetical protein
VHPGGKPAVVNSASRRQKHVDDYPYFLQDSIFCQLQGLVTFKVYKHHDFFNNVSGLVWAVPVPCQKIENDYMIPLRVQTQSVKGYKGIRGKG